MSNALSHVHFDAKDHPRERRFDMWRLALAATYDVVLLDSDPEDFEGSVDGWMIGDLLFAHSRLPAVRFSRDENKIKDENSDHYVFMYIADGGANGNFNGRAVDHPGGTTIAIDMTQPFSSAGKSSDSISVSVPRHRLEESWRSSQNPHGAVIDGALGRLLGEHLASTIAIAPELTASEAGVIAQTTINLFAACLSSRLSGTKESTPLMSLAVRNDMQRHIEQNLHRVDLDPQAVYKSLGISRATAYRAFQGTEGIAKYIQSRRMLAARTMLLHPDERRTITEIASAVGYADGSLFSHTYKRTFGHPPSETRNAPAAQNLSPIEISSKANRDNYRRWMRDLQTHFTPDQS
jgi:AraC-like DNA-binding protein